MGFEVIRKISIQTESRIVLLVIDGLGGLPDPQTGKTELETAVTPNLDDLAAKGTCGLIDPVSRGITPGSGPGHLAIFGFDPVRFDLGRGILEAAGIDSHLREEDVAARGNFATMDSGGKVTDRRAGRISNEKNAELCKILEGVKMEGPEVIVRPIKEHRFLAVFRGAGRPAELTDTDSAGEDGDFQEKVTVIENVDRLMPLVTDLGPDRVREFSESACLNGGLGRFAAVDIMPLVLAHARKLKKSGA